MLKNQLRPSWDEYFMQIAFLVAQRSTCVRHHVGAVTVRDKRVLTTGYNGAVSGKEHCIDIGCMRDKLKIKSGTMHEKCHAVHGEQNAILQATTTSVTLEGASLYCTHHPCGICAKFIRQAKIKKVYYCLGYPDDYAEEIFGEAGIELIKMEKPIMQIIVKE